MRATWVVAVRCHSNGRLGALGQCLQGEDSREAELSAGWRWTSRNPLSSWWAHTVVISIFNWDLGMLWCLTISSKSFMSYTSYRSDPILSKAPPASWNFAVLGGKWGPASHLSVAFQKHQAFHEISTPKYPKLNSLVLKNEVYFCTHLPSFEQPCLAILRVWLQPWELFCTEISPFSALL